MTKGKTNNRFISKEQCENFILYSSDDLALLRLAEAEFIAEYSQCEIERFDQEDLELSELFTALDSMSFFEERRIVVLRFDDIAKIKADDFSAISTAIEECEGARVVVFLNFPDRYSAEGKQAKALKLLFDRCGVQKQFAVLTGERLKKHIVATAELYDCEIQSSAVDMLVVKFSKDLLLLENEIAKAASASSYSTITSAHVDEITTTVLSADIFSLVSLMVAKDYRQCFARLSILLEQGNEPIAILAAVTGSFVDIHRVGVGLSLGKRYNDVFKDFGYKGSDYRLKKASEIAKKVGGKKVSQIMKLLLEADIELKSTAAERDVVLFRYLLEVSHILGMR